MSTESSFNDAQQALAQVLEYHQITKHFYHQYAEGPQFLDWDDQPDPFRRFSGAPLIPLQHFPVASEGTTTQTSPSSPAYSSIFSAALQSAHPVTFSTISQLLYDSLALSAWKQAGNAKWSVRVNPSSGNLHPTESYLFLPAIVGVSEHAAIYHYAAQAHGLEQRAILPAALWQLLAENYPAQTFFMGLSSIHWREAWKYGTRAFRYCQHDVGHALAALTLAARALGWHLQVVEHFSSDELTALFGLTGLNQGRQAEHPDCFIALTPIALETIPERTADFATTLANLVATLEWKGEASLPSQDTLRWKAIEKVAKATHKPVTAITSKSENALNSIDFTESPPVAFRQIVRQRRSAIAMDGQTTLELEQFSNIIKQLLPIYNPIFATLPYPAHVDLLLFVHRVQGLTSGIYCLLRTPSAEFNQHPLPPLIRSDSQWQAVPELDLPLYQLVVGDARQLAKQLSCHQSIASDGCFSVGMLAQFNAPLQHYGSWFYPRLFWETGMIGQMLYLAAEANGMAGTGIGCFFDDAVHELLGFKDNSYQSLYHFTVGGRVNDNRLLTLAAYELG